MSRMNMGTDAPIPGGAPSQAGVEQSQDSGLGFNLDLVRSLRMHRALAFTVAATILLLLVPLGLTRKPAYRAITLIYVQPVTSKSPTNASGTYDSMRYETYMEQQLLTFRRPDILGRALDQFPPAIRNTFPADSSKAISRVDADLTVTRVPGSYQIAVQVISRDPSTVAPIANGIALAYLKDAQQDDDALNNQQLSSLLQDRKQIANQLEQSHQEQASLGSTLGMADTNTRDAANPFDVDLADLRAQLAVARNAHSAAEARLASLGGKSDVDSADESDTREDSELSALKSNLGSRRAALIAEMNGLTTTNPLYKKDQAELDQLSQTIVNFTAKSGKNLKGQYQLEVQRTGDLQARLEAQLGRQTAAATSKTPKLQHAQDLAESIKALQDRYTEVDNAIHNLVLAQGPSFATHITLPATQPTGPMPSKKIAILVLALPIAIFFAIIAAILKHLLDSRIYIGEDVNRALKIPPMAVLPDAGEVSRRVNEEFIFRLVAGLEQTHRLGSANTFVFTASSLGTDIESIVAAVCAQLESVGYRTMSTSAAETLSPVESKSEQRSPELANSSNLATTSDSQTGIRTRREGIMEEHLERLKGNVDFLFIKAQPIRSSAQAEFVVRLGDVTVLVAESGKTTRKELRSCLSIIRRLRARGVAIVVSKLKLHNADGEFLESVQFAEDRSSEYPLKNRTVKS